MTCLTTLWPLSPRRNPSESLDDVRLPSGLPGDEDLEDDDGEEDDDEDNYWWL